MIAKPEPAPVSTYAPGWRKWVAPATIMLSTLLSYIDRQTLAVLSPTILQDTGLSASAFADALAVFQIFYMIGNPLWGSTIDFLGLRLGMLAAVLLWTLASASHAWVAGFIGFAAARAVLGFGEGAAFPGVMRTATDSLPANRQARGIALGYSGASMGAIITPLVVTPIALKFGWRSAFLVTGGLGALWLLVWYALARPPFLPAVRHAPSKFIWPNILERRAWVVISSFGLGGVALGVVAYLSPLYLSRVLNLSQAELGHVAWIPLVGWEIGYFFWGWVADRFVPDAKSAAPFFALLALLALPSMLTTLTQSLPMVLALFFWATFIADGFVVLSLRVGSHIFPKDRTAMVAGIGSGAWSLVLVVLLPVYGRLIDLKWYGLIFASMSLMPVLGTTIWMLLSRPWRTGEVAV
jgi:ACS family hexuronate transporter-like MFS transporter